MRNELSTVGLYFGDLYWKYQNVLKFQKKNFIKGAIREARFVWILKPNIQIQEIKVL